MTRISQFDRHTGERIKGQYRLRSAELRWTRYGDPFKRLVLDDATGQVAVYVWENSGYLHRLPYQVPVPVAAALEPRWLNNSVVANLVAIRSLSAYEIRNAAALLPAVDCPAAARDPLDKLVAFNEALNGPLREFLNRVLADPDIGVPLLTCKGSQRNHHQYPGGLLTHSVQVMAIAGDMARTRLTELETAVIQLGALLHDVGKVRSIGPGNVRPVHQQIVRHETQTHRLLEPHLSWLDQRDPKAAAGLNYILDFISQPRANRGYAKFLGAELIEAADRMSAALANQKQLHDFLGRLGLGQMYSSEPDELELAGEDLAML